MRYLAEKVNDFTVCQVKNPMALSVFQHHCADRRFLSSKRREKRILTRKKPLIIRCRIEIQDFFAPQDAKKACNLVLTASHTEK
jgi:hypothetical protein